MLEKRGATLQIDRVGVHLKDVLKNNLTSTKATEEGTDDFVYFVARAITADIPNSNGDMFPKDELKKSYESFIGKGLYLNHEANKVEGAVGKIIDAWWVEKERDCHVLCLCKVDKQANPLITRKIATGIINSVSMGCSCETSTCSICGKEMHSAEDFCEHMMFLGREIKTKEGMKKVVSINSGIHFTELSLVSNPADEKALLLSVYANAAVEQKAELLKVASDMHIDLEKKADNVVPLGEQLKETPDYSGLISPSDDVAKAKAREEGKLGEEEIAQPLQEVDKPSEKVEKLIDEEAVEPKEKEEKEHGTLKDTVKDIKKDVKEVDKVVKDLKEDATILEQQIKEEKGEGKEDKKEKVIDEKKEEKPKEEKVEDKKEVEEEEFKKKVLSFKKGDNVKIKDIDGTFEIMDVFKDGSKYMVEVILEGKKKVFSTDKVTKIAIYDIKIGDHVSISERLGQEENESEANSFIGQHLVVTDIDLAPDAMSAYVEQLEQPFKGVWVSIEYLDKIDIGEKESAEMIPPKPADTSLTPNMKWVFDRNSKSWKQVPKTDKTVETTVAEKKADESLKPVKVPLEEMFNVPKKETFSVGEDVIVKREPNTPAKGKVMSVDGDVIKVEYTTEDGIVREDQYYASELKKASKKEAKLNKKALTTWWNLGFKSNELSPDLTGWSLFDTKSQKFYPIESTDEKYIQFAGREVPVGDGLKYVKQYRLVGPDKTVYENLDDAIEVINENVDSTKKESDEKIPVGDIQPKPEVGKEIPLVEEKPEVVEGGPSKWRYKGHEIERIQISYDRGEWGYYVDGLSQDEENTFNTLDEAVAAINESLAKDNPIAPTPAPIPEVTSKKKANEDNGPSDQDVQEKAWEMFKAHWNALSSEQMDQVYEALEKEKKGSKKEAFQVGDKVMISGGPSEGNTGMVINVSGDDLTVDFDPVNKWIGDRHHEKPKFTQVMNKDNFILAPKEASKKRYIAMLMNKVERSRWLVLDTQAHKVIARAYLNDLPKLAHQEDFKIALEQRIEKEGIEVLKKIFKKEEKIVDKKASAFDKVDKIDVAEGVIAVKNKETGDIDIKNAEGTLILNVPDAFGEDIVPIIKILQMLLPKEEKEEQKTLEQEMIEPPSTVVENPADVLSKEKDEKIIKLESELSKAKNEVIEIQAKNMLEEKIRRCNYLAYLAFEKGMIVPEEQYIITEMKKSRDPYEVKKEAINRIIDQQSKDLIKLSEEQIKAFEDSLTRFNIKASKASQGRDVLNVPFVASADLDDEGTLGKELKNFWSRSR